MQKIITAKANIENLLALMDVQKNKKMEYSTKGAMRQGF
jgi:hypothetical protein